MKPPTGCQHGHGWRLVRVFLWKSQNAVVDPIRIVTIQPMHDKMPLENIVLARPGLEKTNRILLHLSELFLEPFDAQFRGAHGHTLPTHREFDAPSHQCTSHNTRSHTTWSPSDHSPLPRPPPVPSARYVRSLPWRGWRACLHVFLPCVVVSSHLASPNKDTESPIHINYIYNTQHISLCGYIVHLRLCNRIH